MRAFRFRPLPLALLAAVVGACGGGDRTPASSPEGDVGGTLVLTVPGAPGSLLPPHVQTIPSKQITDLVYERLAEIGPSLNTIGDEDFAPQLARSWSWAPDSLSIVFHLDSAARFHDGVPVTAEDVHYTLMLNKDPATGSGDRQYLASIDSVTGPDAYTAVVWFARRYPEQFFDAAARVSILPKHVLHDVEPADLRSHAFATRPMGSGRFRFVEMVPNERVVLAADTAHHLGRPKLDRVVMTIAPDPVAATTQLLTGNADMYEGLRLENMAQVAADPDLEARVVPGTAYSFLAFNFRDRTDSTRPHPVLGERAVRRAIAMAVDRRAVVRTVMDTLGVVGAGPFSRALPVADTTTAQVPFDTARAAALLDSLGWRDGDGDGVRERGGRPLSLVILVPTSSALRQRIAVALQQQLAAIGVRLDIRQLELNAFQEQMGARRFDLVMGSWVLTDGSPSGLRNTWGTGGTQNFGRYVNPAFDAQVDSGNAAFDRAARRAHFSRAFATIAEDVPAVWLYEPHNAIALARRFRTPPLRSTGWWLDLAEWWIPADQRIDRDRVGLPSVARR
jgi:peptide/nickel transport system substrate-binding protein